MPKKLFAFLDKETVNLRDAGLLRKEVTLYSGQEEKVTIRNRRLVNLASNNYLGLADHPTIKEAATKAIVEYGAGIASARVATGTQLLHARLERALSAFLVADGAMIFPSGYHANTGLFEPLFNERDFVFCDAMCHPSLADGLRLSKARVQLYRTNDVNFLEDRLKRSRSARFRAIVTDGVFALNGNVANLEGICSLAAKYDALVIVDDAHGVGVLGTNGRGTAEHLAVMSRIDVFTGSFGHALGGGSGGFLAGRHQIITWLRQKSRPYLTSTSLNPASTAAALAAVELVDKNPELRKSLQQNTTQLRKKLADSGLNIIEGPHPIIAVLVGDAVTAQKVVDQLHSRSMFALGFCYPVVPEGEARVRIQLCVQHSDATLTRVARAFESIGKELNLI